jgi:hypothetical protein
MDPNIQALTVQLADVGVRNTAGAIADRVGASRARKKHEETIAELEEIVNDLLADKSELVRIAHAYEAELVAQRISPTDIEYIATHFVPILEQLVSSVPSDDEASVQAMIELFKPLLSVETVTILQLLGFNFRQAIGEPLTELVAHLISSRVPTTGAQAAGSTGQRKQRR